MWRIMSGSRGEQFKNRADANANVHMKMGELDTLVSGKVAEAILTYEQTRN